MAITRTTPRIPPPGPAPEREVDAVAVVTCPRCGRPQFATRDDAAGQVFGARVRAKPGSGTVYSARVGWPAGEWVQVEVDPMLAPDEVPGPVVDGKRSVSRLAYDCLVEDWKANRGLEMDPAPGLAIAYHEVGAGVQCSGSYMGAAEVKR